MQRATAAFGYVADGGNAATKMRVIVVVGNYTQNASSYDVAITAAAATTSVRVTVVHVIYTV